MALILSDEAYKDLENIFDFISQDSTSRAKKFINELFQEIEKTLLFRKSIYFDSDKYRDKIFKKYTIIFKIDEVDIFILAIFKGRNFRSK